ncbi:MAG: hypothetical protein IPL99_25255 [Candidatus Competibacteraceae bacterium]|nr:hypothetical protein [Candidatus Competibacteraceae bacterium]
MKPSGPFRWPRVIALALMIAAGPAALAWQHFQVDREYHALYLLLNRARTQAMQAGPVIVRFTPYTARVEGLAGDGIESLFLTSLEEVRYQTTQGDQQIIFSAGGPTSPYNIHLHGGDVTLKSWTGYERSLWVHCSGGVTQGRNQDWTPNRH